jgi:glucosamine--fructose-6-phosphate aminotransferase (isomerizing)
MPLEEYHHYRSQKRGDPLFLVAPDAASRERALDTALVGQAVGGRTVALAPEGESEIAARAWRVLRLPAISPELAPMVYSVPLHLFAYHFAEARFARGLGYAPALPAE